MKISPVTSYVFKSNPKTQLKNPTSDYAFNSNISFQDENKNIKDVKKSVETPLFEGLDIKLLDFHVNVNEAILRGQNKKIAGTEFIFAKDGFEYFYTPSMNPDRCMVFLKGIDADNQERIACVHCDLFKETFDYQFINFNLSKNYKNLNAVMDKNHIERFIVQKDLNSKNIISYEFDENNRAKSAKIIDKFTNKVQIECQLNKNGEMI